MKKNPLYIFVLTLLFSLFSTASHAEKWTITEGNAQKVIYKKITKTSEAAKFSRFAFVYQENVKRWVLFFTAFNQDRPKEVSIIARYIDGVKIFQDGVQLIQYKKDNESGSKRNPAHVALALTPDLFTRLARARSLELVLDNRSLEMEMKGFPSALERARDQFAVLRRPTNKPEEPTPLQKYANAKEECNRLATHPWDNRTEDAGVKWDHIDGRAAVSACLKVESPTSSDKARMNYQLGRAYDKVGDKGAFVFLSSAAREDYPIALFHMGVLYRDGIYVDKDTSRAREFFRRASDLGSIPGKYEFARMEYLQRGNHGGRKQAEKMLMEVASVKYVQGMEFLAIEMSKGKISGRTPDMGVLMLIEASKKGGSLASYRLAEMYKSGITVQKSEQSYRDYMRTAARQGHKKAKELGF